MGSLREKLLSFFLLLFISMPFYVSALPDGAATCNVNEMATIGHGPSKLKGSAGYLMAVNMQGPGKFELVISGPGEGVEGMLVYVVDANNKRLGQFTNLPPNMKIKADCDGQTTVTHMNQSIKKFPFKLNWVAPAASGSLTIKSLVVKDYSDWAKLDDVGFDSVTGASSTVAGGASDDTTGSTGSTGSGFLQKYSLFIIMISITTLLYIVGSVTEAMLKRQQVKSRSFAKTIQNGFGDSR